METAKKVQDSKKKIAAGFCALSDKNGNWICHTVSMDADKQLTHDRQDLQFHPCEKIQNDLASTNIMAKEATGCTLNLGKVNFVEVAQDLQKSAPTAVQQNVTEQRHERNR